MYSLYKPIKALPGPTGQGPLFYTGSACIIGSCSANTSGNCNATDSATANGTILVAKNGNINIGATIYRTVIATYFSSDIVANNCCHYYWL